VPFTISGHVTSLVGYPAGTAQVAVGFYDGTSWQYSTAVDVATDGVFSVDATNGPGEYDLYFTVPGYSVPFVDSYFGSNLVEPDPSLTTNSGVIYDPTATDTSVTVALAPAGYFTGTVESQGTVIPGEDVEAFDTVSSVEYDSTSLTDAFGNYSTKAAAGDPMEIGVGTLSEFYPQTYNAHNGGVGFDPVTVTAGHTTTGIDFNLVPIGLSFAIALSANDENGDLVEGPIAHLFVDDGAGDNPQEDSSLFEGGFGFVAGISPGEYTMNFSNGTGGFYPIESLEIGNSASVVPTNPCLADLGSIVAPNGGPEFVELTLDLSSTACDPVVAPPATPPVTHHRTVDFTATAPAATPTATPTPTPTPTPTASPSASPSPSPSASSTPAPAVAPPAGGLPWWAWLLIVVGILILAGIAFAIFRRR
jgi:hypothetical protein